MTQATLLKVEQLTKNFDGVRALDHVDMVVARETIHGLIGPNGSGKTTLFNIITGLLPANDGKVSFDSQEIENLSAVHISKMGIARTFQGGKIVPSLTSLENVMSGAFGRTKTDIRGTFFNLPLRISAQEKKMRVEAQELLELVGLGHTTERWASDLVWVERQLLQVARALAANPKLLLLDEPTSGMGQNESDRVKTLIQKVKDTGITVILVSHDVKLVAGLSERVTVLNTGKMICEGTPEQVQKDPLVLEAYLGADYTVDE
jgi:branched-chain amino acid transport system ATP-binding protein